LAALRAVPVSQAGSLVAAGGGGGGREGDVVQTGVGAVMDGDLEADFGAILGMVAE
jgi:hypothetical protein